MKRVKILKQFTCAPDGAVTKKFKAGDVVDLQDNLAESALKSGAAELVKAEEAPKENAFKKKSGKKKAGKKKSDENKAKSAGDDK